MSVAIPAALACCGQGGDHIVGLDPLDRQDRHAHGPHQGMQGLDLGPQLVRHGRAVSFILGVEVVAEGLALGVEDHGQVVRRMVLDDSLEHRGDPMHGPGRLAARGRERRQGVEGPVEIRRPVDQQQELSAGGVCYAHESFSGS